MSHPYWQCYSDASVHDRVSAYAYVVLKDRRVYATESGILFTQGEIHSLVAELWAMVRALRRVSDSSEGRSYSDLYSIDSILNEQALWHDKRAEAVKALKTELARTGLGVEYSPELRSQKHYKRCHELANQAARRFLRHDRSGRTLLSMETEPDKQSSFRPDLWPATLRYYPFRDCVLDTTLNPFEQRLLTERIMYKTAVF